ncbi:MAG: hypothetical protein ACP5P6_10460, partial [Candidatus Saccharicenans sp.]
EHTWRRDPKTGWECWVDEYYFIYPDQTAIRKVSWKKGTLGFPRQFQESEVFLQPGQRNCDVVEKDFAQVADYNGNSMKVSFNGDPDKPPSGPYWDKYFDYTVQQINFKAQNKPFICFEPPNQMWLRYKKLNGYNLHTTFDHWPVGQARCDGRRTVMADRPSHSICYPVSDPVIHEAENREYWFGLYGMNDLPFDQIIKFGRSWVYPAELVLTDNNFKSEGYDRSERCYKINDLSSKPESLTFILKGSKSSPIINPAFYIKNWNGQEARVLVDNKEIEGTKIGINKTLEGNDLILFIPIHSESDIQMKIISLK